MALPQVLEEKWTLEDVNLVVSAARQVASDLRLGSSFPTISSTLAELISKQLSGAKSPEAVRLLFEASPTLLVKDFVTKEDFDREMRRWSGKVEPDKPFTEHFGATAPKKSECSKPITPARRKLDPAVQQQDSLAVERKRQRLERISYASAAPPKMRGKRWRPSKLLGRIGKDDALELRDTTCGRLAVGLISALEGDFQKRCVYEWFYATLDEPYFRRNVFQERISALEESQGCSIGKHQRLTRFEWSLVRPMMGYPRRFSAAFLDKERQDLQRYRDEVRGIQRGEPGTLDLKSFPYQVWSGLEVGVRVTGIYRKGKELKLATGAVLGIDKQKHEHQVLWDVPHLGVTTCPDYELRPAVPIEVASLPGSVVTFPAAPEGPSGILDTFTGLRTAVNWKNVGDAVEVEVNGKGEHPFKAAGGAFQASPVAQSRLEAMARVLALLDRKETLIAEVRHLNQLAEKRGESVKLDKSFKDAMSWLLSTLSQTNKALGPARHQMRKEFLESPIEQSSTRGDNVTGQIVPEAGWQNEFANRWLHSSKLLLEQLHSAQLEELSIETQLNDKILHQASIRISLLLAIRNCAEMCLSPSDINSALDALMERLAPSFELNQDVFKQVKSLVSLMKAGCTQR